MEESRLKQRLVGAIVLVALAVIFIPMLLSGGRETEMPVFGSNVPERSPAVKDIKHIDIEQRSSSKTTVDNPQKVPISKKLPEPEVKKKDSKSIIETIVGNSDDDKKPAIKETVWAVQVGSFNNRKNALGLKAKLQKKKYPAFVERIMKNNKPVYRVRVGPEISQKKAQAVKLKLKKEFKLDGLVVKHP